MEATALLKPRVSLQFEDGKTATLRMLDYSQVGLRALPSEGRRDSPRLTRLFPPFSLAQVKRGIRNNTVAHFDFVFGSDITYSEQMGLTVARACYSPSQAAWPRCGGESQREGGSLGLPPGVHEVRIVVSVQEVVHQR